MDINKKFNAAVDDVVDEALNHKWKRVIEATMEIASMIKSAKLGKRAFLAVMENLKTEIKVRGGEELLLDFEHAMHHRQHYLSNSAIILPFRG